VAISKRLRFEVLRRDGFRCVYCHRSDVILTVDHVTPKALGGTDDPSNLVTCCDDCNTGKSSSGSLEAGQRLDHQVVINAAAQVWRTFWMPEHQAEPPAELVAEFHAQASALYPDLIGAPELMSAAQRVAFWKTPDLKRWCDVEFESDDWNWGAFDAMRTWCQRWTSVAGARPTDEDVQRAELNLRAAISAGYGELDVAAYLAASDQSTEIATYFTTAPALLKGLLNDAAWDAARNSEGEES
jgi:hypothetical protein